MRASVLSCHNSARGHMRPIWPRWVIVFWTLSNASVNVPKLSWLSSSTDADPLGPNLTLPSSGKRFRSVSSLVPKRNSPPTSSVNREIKSCMSQALWAVTRAARRSRAVSEYRPRISKSDTRTLLKKGRAIARFWVDFGHEHQSWVPWIIQVVYP